MAVADILNGPVVIWKAPVGEALPDDSTGVGVAWGGNWETYAYTKAPLSCNYTATELEIMVQQELTAVNRVKSGENLTFETVLAEITSARMAVATSGTPSTTAAAAGQVGKDELDVGGESAIDQYAWGFEGTYVNSSGTQFPARWFMYKGTANLNAAQEWSVADYPGIPIQVKALVDTTKSAGSKLFKFQRVTAAAA